MTNARNRRSILLVTAFAFAFFTQFLLSKSLFLIADAEFYARFTLVLTCALSLRICWYGIWGPVFAKQFTAPDLEANGQINVVPYFCQLMASPLLLLPPLAMLMIFLPESWSAKLGFSASDIFPSFALAMGIGITSAFIEIANARGKIKQTIIAMLFPGFAQFSACLLVGWLGLSFSHFLWFCAITTLGCAISLMIGDLKNARAIHLPLPATAKTNIITHAKPMFFWVPAQLAMRTADKWLIALYLGLFELAAFAIIILLSQSVMAAITSIAQRSLQAKIFRQSDINKRWRVTSFMASTIGFVGITLGVSFAFFGDFFLRFFDARFALYHVPLIGAVCAATLQGLTQALLLFGHSNGDVKPFSRSRYIEACAYLLGLFALLPLYGIQGIAIAWLVAALVGFLQALNAANYLRNGTANAS